jgi:hypothetical protein
MKQENFSDYIIYVDESGESSLKSIDKEYPIFVLAFCIFNKKNYSQNAVKKLKEVKFKYFGHDMIILHENEIYRDKGSFKKFKNKEYKDKFINDLTKIIKEEDFTIIATAIKKEDLFTTNNNPYHIALKYCMERAYKFLEEKSEHNKITHIIVEKRGKEEDNNLELEFRRVCDGNNYDNIKMNFDIIMSSKLCNSAGLQLADLVARPIGRRILKPNQENRAFEIIKSKFYKNKFGNFDGVGLKIFPNNKNIENMFEILED